MIKNFLVKKGDQLSFTITFSSPIAVTGMEFGVKEKYSDSNYTIIKSLYKQTRNIIFIGDSYLEGYTPDGRVTGWGNVVASMMPDNNYIIKYKGGTGFANTVDNQNFVTLLNSINSSDTITDIIVCGGYNDRYSSSQQVINGITQFVNTARQKFPNASVKISMVGWSAKVNQQDSLRRTISDYIAGCEQNKVTYMKDVQNTLHTNEYFASDQIHPNQEGENKLAENIIPYIPVIYAGGISKISDSKFQVVVPSEETQRLNITNYVFDLRIKIGNIVKTPLSGKLMIKETTFETE